MGYALHQSFYIRSNWMSKALSHLDENDFFTNKNNHLRLGIGKNMFQSLKFWSSATQIAKKDAAGHLYLSEFGSLIRKYDPDVLDKNTLSILHYHICQKNSGADSWFWFFNELPATQHSFIKEDLFLEYMIPYVQNYRAVKVSETSLRKDLDCLLHFYTATENRNDPEDVIYSPFSVLGLLEIEDERSHVRVNKKSGSLDRIGEGALMYSLIDTLQKQGVDSISLSDILTVEGCWGRIFNMDRKNTAEALNRLSLNPDNQLSFIRTNALDTVVCELADPLAYLAKFYERRGDYA